jgi:hypothetical protein
VAIEFDGPSHFAYAPRSEAGNAGTLFAETPRRHHGDARVREALVRANPGWVVMVVPFFDW